MNMSKYFFRVMVIVASFLGVNTALAVSMTTEEQTLYQLLNQYRAQYGLAAIPASPSLTLVAQTHAKDLDANPPSGSCNLHSWSNNGSWTGCCYTSDHAQAQCMWNKPSELTSYPGYGFEISAYSSAMNAQNALNMWKSSSGHNAVMINQGTWANTTWKAVGVGIYRNYAVIWFGRETDSASFDTNSGNTGTGDTGSTGDSSGGEARLINISSRANVRGGANDAVAGFVLSGSGTQQVLMRGIAVDTQVDPYLSLFKFNSGNWNTIATNNEWKSHASANTIRNLAGRYQLPDRQGNDAGMLLSLGEGVYTAQLSSIASSGAEVIGVDAIDDSGPSLMNISTRAYISGGSNDIFAGFVIAGSGSLRVLLRGIAVDNTVDPVLTLSKYDNGSWVYVTANNEWESSSSAAAISALSSSLQLPDRYNNDAGILIDLTAGTYSLQLGSASGTGSGVLGVDAIQEASQTTTTSRFSVDQANGTIADNVTNLMWINSNLSHSERAEALTYCANLVHAGYSDWKLPSMSQAGEFHLQTNTANITPTQRFSGCTAEVVSDGYVRTKKGAETYGGNPGDPINFRGGANVRCVRSDIPHLKK